MPLPNTKISQLPTDTVLDGSEILTGISGQVNQNITVQQIADYIIAQIGGGSATPDFVLTEGGEDFNLVLIGDDFILST